MEIQYDCINCEPVLLWKCWPKPLVKWIIVIMYCMNTEVVFRERISVLFHSLGSEP